MRRHQNMPVIARRGRLKILMYYNDHAPPHVHVDAGGDYQVVVSVRRPTIPPDALSKLARKEVLAWMREHTVELLDNWERARDGDVLEVIPWD